MSTEIKDTVTGWGPHTLTGGVRNVGLLSRSGGGRKVNATMPRADFLAAVAAECGVVVIDRAELPTASPGGHVRVTPEIGRMLAPWDTPESLRAEARAALALAEYLDAHPPVDEALVDDLATAAYRHLSTPVNFDRSDAARYIRALIKSGRIEVKP